MNKLCVMFNFWIITLIFMIHKTFAVVSYNQPKFSPNATWNQYATTFADNWTVGITPFSIFVDTNNIVYVAASTLNLVQVWLEGSISPITVNFSNLSSPMSLFTTIIGEIYIDNGINGRVEKSILNTKETITVMDGNIQCFGLFVDINNTLYCSMRDFHQVVKKSLDNTTSPSTIVAGNGTFGSLLHMLWHPCGIFVDTNFDLYVADLANSRIQLFKPGELNGTTLAGNGAPGNKPLSRPSGIVLDGDKYLFIADSANNRIVRSGPDSFQCLIGCSGGGSESNQLKYPRTLHFDSYGNIFVADANNNRIQKFDLSTNFTSSTMRMFSTENTLSNFVSQESTMTTISIETTLSSVSSKSIQQESTMKISPTQNELLSTSSEMPILPQNCVSIKLLTKSSLLEYKLNEDIFISSNIQFDCEELFSFAYQWIISNCTSIFNCSVIHKFQKNISTTSNELYIPSNTFTFGVYKLQLILNSIFSSESVYIKIIKSHKLIVNLIQFGISEIILGENQELLLEPEKHSFHTDGKKLIENEWNFEFYCRIYDFSNYSESFEKISNSSCFSNQLENKTKSSSKISVNSFKLNRTYQLMVIVNNRLNSSLEYRGYLIVRLQTTFSHRISIRCAISSMCIPEDEYQLINPNTQLSLYSDCLDNCSLNKIIYWNIYRGTIDFSTKLIQWTQINETILTFGNNTNHLTVPNEFFIINRSFNYLKFEVIYKFQTDISSSSIYLKKNSPPSNGSCSIDPLNSTTTTTGLFNIVCSNWFDEHGIKDYLFYIWSDGYSKEMMIGFSLTPTFKLRRLPVGNNKSSSINITVSIRDTYDCITKYSLSAVNTSTDTIEIDNLFKSFQDSKGPSKNNSFINELLAGNQNDIGQILTLLSQQLNKVHNNNLHSVLSSGLSMACISISTLNSQTFQSMSAVVNESILGEYTKQLNVDANIREYLINFTTNLIIGGSDSIILQSSSLVKLTEATNQLTRLTLMIASDKCYQLAVSLNEISEEISFEDVQIAITFLTQCTSNILNSINGPLQERTNLLNIDLLRSQQLFDNIEERNLNYQKDFINKITSKINETIFFLTSSLNKHLNAGQSFTVNTSEVYMSFEKISGHLLSNKQIQLIENSQINFPLDFSSNLNENENILIRSKLDRLAPYGNYLSNTNFSRLLTFSIVNENGNEISMKTNHSIELIIPRDPSLVVPKMILQNVTNYNQSFYFKLIHLEELKLNKNLTISIHFEIEPFNLSVAYFFVYQFDKPIELNQLDGVRIFCPSNLTNQNIYQYYIDNQRLSIHQSVIFGLRQLTSEEFRDICLNNSMDNFTIKNSDSNFTSNYNLRIYSSGCYYLDQFNNWQSVGLLVGPKTNLNQTQCFTNHF